VGTVCSFGLGTTTNRPVFSKRLPGLRGGNDPGDRLRVLRELLEAGKVTPVIDRTYPLIESPEAVRYLEEGHPRGKVVVTV
jgi:NADPH:quinone reductase-like Zn-dependent oxidoreductase